MSLGIVAFLLGLFGVPLVLLGVAHKLRRRSARVQAGFWGAVWGHCIAGVIAVTWGMIPPEAWTDSEVARGAAGLWGLLTIPAIGALVRVAAAGGAKAQRPREGKSDRAATLS
ncbi:MAG: hypothetical protein MNPFHGCM_00257 [Gemmatimonadaceae bacterium]|nr:hypothetical protein [Gemmatimonadaceae bacterium]